MWQAALATGIILVASANAGPLSGCELDGRYVMGTVLQVTVCSPEASRRQVVRSVFAETERLEAMFSGYDPTSVLSRLNAQAGTGATSVPSEVAHILSLSVQYWQRTGGAFDITIGPLITLWKHAAVTNRRPSADLLRATRARVGSDKIRVDEGRRVFLASPDMRVDLGGIAKGYALDRVIERLSEQGPISALLNFGQSSAWALGAPPTANHWRLLLRGPGQYAIGTITLRDQALSVSGSLGRSTELGGRRYGHIVDPRTGQPLQHDRFAYVVGPSAAQAEALSTALVILGGEEGIALLDGEEDVEGMVVEPDGRRWASVGWTARSGFAPL